MRSSETSAGPCRGKGPVASDRCLPRGRHRGLHGRPATRGYGCRDRGAVTAEAAVVIPVLVAFVIALLWALMATVDQIRCVDAARAGARAAARSEPEAAVLEVARDAAPHGARVELGRAGDLWRVRVEAPTSGPGVLALTLSAEAAALAEDTVGDAGP
ncbi:TadE family type IV pilus minor pilin [Streptomyces sp. NPDC102283]|uniref:TadE family type IV pilus minor pilin n=1 Tax=Streptomyces sp. NPDC102283 TaxID=3366155 RepID=UPI00381A7974